MFSSQVHRYFKKWYTVHVESHRKHHIHNNINGCNTNKKKKILEAWPLHQYLALMLKNNYTRHTIRPQHTITARTQRYCSLN
jgi:hypothetical protein